MAEQTFLAPEVQKYLTEALVRRAAMPIDTAKVYSVLGALRYDPSSSRTRFSLTDIEVDLDHTHKDNNQTAGDDGSEAMIHLRRILRNQRLAYTNGKGLTRKIQEALYQRGLVTFDSNVVCRLVREDPKTLPLILKSAEAGYEWSLMGLYAKTYYDKQGSELTLRRPLIIIPGITSEKDLQTLTEFEDNFQRPSKKEFLKRINQGTIRYTK